MLPSTVVAVAIVQSQSRHESKLKPKSEASKQSQRDKQKPKAFCSSLDRFAASSLNPMHPSNRHPESYVLFLQPNRVQSMPGGAVVPRCKFLHAKLPMQKLLDACRSMQVAQCKPPNARKPPNAKNSSMQNFLMQIPLNPMREQCCSHSHSSSSTLNPSLPSQPAAP